MVLFEIGQKAFHGNLFGTFRPRTEVPVAVRSVTLDHLRVLTITKLEYSVREAAFSETITNF